MQLTDIFRRLLFFPVIIIFVVLISRIDVMVQCLNKITDTIVISVFENAKSSPAEKAVIFKQDREGFADKALLDLNSAESNELELLSGIGEVRADAIITQRSRMGGFYSVEDVLCTPGIGLKTLSKIKDFVTVLK